VPYQQVGPLRTKLFENTFGRYTEKTLRLEIDDPVVYLNTIYAFWFDSFPAPRASYFSRLRPIKPLEDKIESFAAQWFHEHVVVGVSIRYKGAHPKTLAASPPEWFIHRINEIHEQFPNVRFFLSTDCEEVSQQVRSSTQASICQFPRNYRNDRPDSIQEALCELYLLTRTNYILGSYWSSFSNMVSSLRGKLAYESSYENSKRRPDEALIARVLATPITTPACLTEVGKSQCSLASKAEGQRDMRG